MKDRKRVKKISGLSQINIDLKPKRSISDVYINTKFDVTNLVNYVEGKDITYFHAFLTALAKTIYNRPKLNYFICNRHLYLHTKVVISFVAKIKFDDKSEEVMVMIEVNDSDNIYTISTKIKEKIDNIRNKKVLKKGANNAIDKLGKLPNIVRVPIVGLFKLFDKYGILPKTLTKDNLYYSSMIVSNLGSIKCGAIYHNINDFGTCSSLATIGEIKNEIVVNDKLEKNIRKTCEFGINLDERIADGYYFAKSNKLLEYILNNPDILEEEMSKKIKLEEIR